MSLNKIIPKTFGDKIFSLKGISRQTIENHLKLYQGYVGKYNEIIEKLSRLSESDYEAVNATYSLIRELKVELTYAWGGITNHEQMFSQLGGEGNPSDEMMKQIEKDFGSYKAFKKDLKATAMAARGWVWLGWNFRDQALYNYLGDWHNTYLIWEVAPLLTLDVYEHAYFIDYGSNRAGYIDAFLANIDWPAVEENFRKVKT